MAEYEAIIGMEVHAQLLTRSKMFCGCDAAVFGAEPNTHVCPVCLGMPGVLPVINRRAVEQTMMVGLALNCEIAQTAVFSRKNYFYPDLPKAYQISMYDFPLCRDGWLQIEGLDEEARTVVRPEQVDEGSGEAGRRIQIRRVHLEEETAKSFHVGDHSLVDFNRAGLPLMEIVTEPDIRTPEEARQYLVTLQTVLRYLGVSTGDMEKGAMRCEPNVSVRPAGTERFGTKVEVKNLNSFRAVKQALEYEIGRQAAVLEAGGLVRQVTMGWDERRGQTVEQRSKETSEDYRYFPEPDLPPLKIERAWVEEIRARLPELPGARRTRFVAEYGLAPDEASVLVADRAVADYFEATAQAGQLRGVQPRTTSNWVTGEIFRLLKAEGIEAAQLPVAPAELAELIALVEQGTITANSSKRVLEVMYTTGQPPAEIVEEQGLAQISDEEALAELVDELLAAHPDQVAKFRQGKETLLQWFVGQVMRATRGKANPQVVTALLERRLRD
jgi:aspartyl-tRNA(Asn)/glutamyl-tRNA(Gln) amidotransferase subunit B